jgi:hypothetical protein
MLNLWLGMNSDATGYEKYFLLRSLIHGDAGPRENRRGGLTTSVEFSELGDYINHAIALLILVVCKCV